MDKQERHTVRKEQSKKSAVKAIWIIVMFAMLFVIIMTRIALSGENNLVVPFVPLYDGMPSNNEVYSAAKQFVLPTLKGGEVNFSEDGYQYGKKADSIFVIRSYAETKTGSENPLKTNFEITLKYKGGPVSSRESWTVLNLDED